jgi:hypothetical protein
MMRCRVLPVVLFGVLLVAGLVGCAAPAPSFPVYQEGRAFPSCTVPIYVSANVPDRPRVKAAAAEFGRISGYRFADSSYADASAHGIVVVWRGGTAPKGGGRANPTYRRSGGRLWTTWRIDLDTWVRSAMSGGTRWDGCTRPRRPGNLMSNSTTIHPVQAGTGAGVAGRVGTAEPWGVPLMAGPVTDGPDVIANLVALLASELGVPVSSRRSPTATKDSDPSVVVRRTGGPSKGVASDNPTVTIEAWAPTTTESFQLLQSARLVVIEAAEQGRAGLRRYDEFAGPADLPDPSTTNPRHTLTASVVTRLE